jgi:hypothetical protein
VIRHEEDDQDKDRTVGKNKDMNEHKDKLEG